MLTAAKNYSITKLELWGLANNIGCFPHLLTTVNFDAVVDHLALTCTMKGKPEPATNCIKRLLEVLSSYKFNFYYLECKDIVLSDFLSRMEGDKSDPHEVIVISINSHPILTGHYFTSLKLP